MRRLRPYREHIGNECADCGFSHPDNRLFDIHHKNGNHEDNRKRNLLTLCPICHRKRHYGIV